MMFNWTKYIKNDYMCKYVWIFFWYLGNWSKQKRCTPQIDTCTSNFHAENSDLSPFRRKKDNVPFHSFFSFTPCSPKCTDWKRQNAQDVTANHIKGFRLSTACSEVGVQRADFNLRGLFLFQNCLINFTWNYMCFNRCSLNLIKYN